MAGERKPIMYGIRPFPMVIFSSVMVISMGLVFQVLAMFSAAPLFGISLSELLSLDPAADPAQLNALKYIQIVGALGTFIVSSLLLSFLYTGSWTRFFSFEIPPRVSLVILLTLIMVAGLPLVNFLTEWNMKFSLPFDRLEEVFRKLEDETEDLMMQLVRAETIPGLLVNLFMIAVIPAVGEELVFRGLLQRHFAGWFKNAHLAILITSVIFSLVHFQFYSFLPRFFLGMVLGYFMLYGRSIWYPIIAHFVNNGIGVVFYYVYLQQKAGDALEEIGTNDMMPMAALYSLVIFTLMMAGWIWMAESTRSASPRKV